MNDDAVALKLHINVDYTSRILSVKDHTGRPFSVIDQPYTDFAGWGGVSMCYILCTLIVKKLGFKTQIRIKIDRWYNDG